MTSYIFSFKEEAAARTLGDIMKIKIHSSCEIEYCVETHLLCKLCVILWEIDVKYG